MFLNILKYKESGGFVKLSDIINGLDIKIINGSSDVEVNALAIDSRKVKKDTLFVCIDGMRVDGHNFIENAAKAGASVVLCEKEVKNLPEGVTVLSCESSRKALADIAVRFYDNPTGKFELIGVTGTNGKTSSTYFMEKILAADGKSSGVIGTVEIRVGGEKLDYDFAASTTPETIELNELFNIMLDKGVDDIVMEVSSHALELDKVRGLSFDIGIFTNLTQDHLDLHKTMENYFRAKAKLFDMCRIGVINADDEYGKRLIKSVPCRVVTFGIDSVCDFKAENIVYKMDRVLFDVRYKETRESFELKVPGRFSVYNALGVIAAAYSKGIDMETIKKGISDIKGVPGRIQNIENNRGFNVIVDYAHSPDGVENIIKSVREFTRGRIITVFGCGGDRDKKKRPIMGEISARLSDYTVLTSDNPRSEEPEDILKDIEAGVKPVTNRYEMIADRREAIFKAVKMAEKGDSVIIAGKGHEDYEIFKDKTIHFDDTEVATEALEDLE